jgi:hypothetical protein
MSNNLAQDLIKRAQTLKAERSNFETEWQNVADIFRPAKSKITVERTAGEKQQIRRLFDSTPIDMSLTLSSILYGTILNRAGRWFGLEALRKDINEEKEVSGTLSRFVEVMLAKMYDSRSNFESAAIEGFRDLVDFGTSATFIEEGDDFEFVCNTLNIRDFYIAENRDGMVDYVIIKTEMAARQIIQKWDGIVTIPDKVIKANEADPFKKFDLQLHIFPRKERDKKKIDILNKAIAGIWLIENPTQIMQEIGWDTMPIAVGRTEKSPNEIYGTSRSMMALADGRTVNTMWKQIIEAGEKTLNPALNVNANYKRRINLTSSALNYPDQKQLAASGRPAIEPIVTVGSIPVNIDLLNLKYESLRKIFFLDKLKIIDDPRATATQVLEQSAERFRLMLPLSIGVEEYMSNFLDRFFDILFRKSYRINDLPNGGSSFDLLPNAPFDFDLPDLLKESPDIRTTFINPINQAQKVTELSSIDTVLNSAAQIAQLKPDVLDLIDEDKVIRKKREILNVDPELLKDERLVAQIRQQRNQAQAEEQEIQDTERLVEGVSKLQ